ncbi:unnamed protein product [Echinostoma caproni]|uniref:C2H2-type domain-containing protein n=1 Tax=Echinostoma caproni TaxID=27848 RepID=A0A183A6W4_9TREM|nr:unnamed protein product [Echinostoma caproni]
MQCQNGPTADNPGNIVKTMCTMATTNNSNMFHSSEPLSSNPTSNASNTMDPNALSFMSKLFPDMTSTLYSQTLLKGTIPSHASQTDLNNLTEDEKCINHFRPLGGDSVVPASLLPFGPFPFPNGISNLSFVPNPIVSGADSIPILSEPRNPNVLLNTNATSMASEAVKTHPGSPQLFSPAMLNNDLSLSQLDQTNSSVHGTKKLGVNSMTEIANLLQLSNMSNMPYPNFAAVDSPGKSKNLTFPGTQGQTQTIKTDEDFCELCQKHFCNKYYLRKHKADVHGIHTEPYSHSRRRESFNANAQKHCTTSQSTVLGLERPGSQISTGVGSNNATTKVSGSSKTNYSMDSDHFSSESGNPMVTSSGYTENGTSSNLLFPSLPVGANPMDYASVLKETFMLNALQSKIPTTVNQNQNTPGIVSSNTSPTSNSSGLPVPMNGMDSMLSAHYYMIALMSSLSPGMAHEIVNSVENTPPQMERNTMGEMFPHLSNAESNTGIREVQCDLCQKVFCNPYFLQVHKANQHNSTNESTREEPDNFAVGDLKRDDKNSATQRSDAGNDYGKLSDLDLQTYFIGQSTRVGGSVDRQSTSGSAAHSLNTTVKPDSKVTTTTTTSMAVTSNSLDVFKSSMVAAKLADRVTCEFCKKELCNKYFLRTHKIRVHGVSPKDVGGPPMRNPPVVTSATNAQHQQSSMSSVSALAHHNIGAMYPCFDPSTNTRLSSAHTIISPGSVGNGLNRTSSGSTSTEVSCPTKSEQSVPSGMFGTLPVALPPPHLANPLFGLPYWPMFSHSISDQNLSGSVTSNTSSAPTTTTCTDSGLSVTTTPSQQTTTASGEAQTLLPLGLNGPENLSATAVISCPICEHTIGPRLFLPSHLTTIHGLNPLDPAFFLNMLRAKVITAASNAHEVAFNGTDNPVEPKKTQSELPNCADSTMPTLVQEEMTDIFSKESGNSQTGVPKGVVISQESVRSLPNHFDGGQISPDQFIHSSPCDSAAAVAAAAAFSNFPINPIEAVVAAMTAASGGPWNATGQQQQQIGAQSGLAPILYQGPPSSVTLSSSCASPIVGMTGITGSNAGGGGGSGGGMIPSATSGMPRKSPNQMRVLCDICNKWICNKYFLRTHRANKHGITDNNFSSTPSMDGYKTNQLKIPGVRSQTSFRGKASIQSLDDLQAMPSPDTNESNSQGANTIRLSERPRSPKHSTQITMDTGSDMDKMESQEKFIQAWKAAYEAGPPTGRDGFGPAYPFPLPGQMPPFINPAMLLPGFPPGPVMAPFQSGLGPNPMIHPQLNYMLPLSHGLESSVSMGKSITSDNPRTQNGQIQSEQDESSDMLTKSMVQSASPIDEKHTDLKLHLPLNLSLKPSSTPLKKRHVKSTPDETGTRSSNGSKRFLILGHLRRAKRFCLHSVWRKQQNQAGKQLTRISSSLVPGGQSKRIGFKDGRQPSQTACATDQMLTTKTTNTYQANLIRQYNMNGGPNLLADSQMISGFDTILSCPLCPSINPIKFTALNPLLQHISLVHGGPGQPINPIPGTNDDRTGQNNSRFVFPTTQSDQTVQSNACPFQVQQLASNNNFSNSECKSHNFLTTDNKQQTELSGSVGLSESSFDSPESVTQSNATTTNNSTNNSTNSNTHLHSIPVSATLHRPVFIPVNSYTETLSTI